jgi:hypothetical protein
MNDLITDLSQLKSQNDNRNRGEYEQISTTRDITGDNFSNGVINFKWENSGLKYWDPSKTYLRTRLRFTKGDGTVIDSAFNTAPNMGLMSNMFYAAEFKINDKPVSKIGSYLPQIDALEKRLTKSKSWLNTIGAATNLWQSSQALRQAEMASDGRIVKDTVAVAPADTVSADTVIGYPALTTVAYVAATGVITFSGGVNTNVAFQVGDYIVLTAGTIGAGALNVKLEVIAVNANLTMTVRADIAANIAANADIRFNRVRPNAVVASESRRVGDFETIWTPPLSIFKTKRALPIGKYELSLTPNSKSIFMKRAIETVLGQPSKEQQNPGAAIVAANIKVEVVSMFLYVYTFEGPRIDNITYYLDLENTRCQADKVNSTSFQNKNFEVSPSTIALTVAYQDLRVGENTALSSSKFRSYEVGVAPTTPQELNLNRFYLNYAGQNLPATDADPEFVAGRDYTIQRYIESQLNSGAYFDTGGPEDIQEFHERGSYYYTPIYRDGTDRSTRCTVYNEFQTGSDVVNTQLLLFEHYRSLATVQISNGRVSSVYIDDE